MHQPFGGAAKRGTVVLINGAFGVGKTTVARALHDRLDGSRLYDPERLGYVLRRLPRWVPGSTAALDDYRDSRLWRGTTLRAIHCLARGAHTVIVPMALGLEPRDELRLALTESGCRVVHVCLVASERTVHERLASRGVSPTSKEGDRVYPRASAACREHSSEDAFAQRVDTDRKSPDAIVNELVALVGLHAS